MINNVPVRQATTAIALNSWTHVAIVWNEGNTLQYFENGKLLFNLSTGFEHTDWKAVRFGVTSFGGYQLAKSIKLDNIKIWDCKNFSQRSIHKHGT